MRAKWLKVFLLIAFLLAGGEYLIWRYASSMKLAQAIPTNAQAILEQGQQFELISLCPQTDACWDGGNRPQFHEVPVLGRTPIRDSKRRAALLSALYSGIVHNDGMPYQCFNPRHGIHAVQGTQTIDLVICFECKNIDIYVNGIRTSRCIGTGPRIEFDRALKQAGLLLSREAGSQ